MALKDLGRRLFMRQAGLGAVAAAVISPAQINTRNHADMLARTNTSMFPSRVGRNHDPVRWALRKTARKLYGEEERERGLMLMMRDGRGLDPDLAALNSWSVAARLNFQRERDRAYRAVSHSLWKEAFGEEDDE